jgi:hypothetical protein
VHRRCSDPPGASMTSLALMRHECPSHQIALCRQIYPLVTIQSYGAFYLGTFLVSEVQTLSVV